VPREYNVEEMSEDARFVWERACGWLREAGAQVVDMSLPNTRHALPAYYVIASAEASSNLARFDGLRYGHSAAEAVEAGELRGSEQGATSLDKASLHELYTASRSAGFGAVVQRRILVGTFALSSAAYNAYFERAQRVRTAVAADFQAAFAQGVDLVLTPTAPCGADTFTASGSDGVNEFINDVMTIPCSLAGLPAVSVKAGANRAGFPLGVQLIGRPYEEAALLGAARVVESRDAEQ
jgi:aspartyl-tRNA(Asn)/glutamyl-tRNA(Gln) amidotransferase subunit A